MWATRHKKRTLKAFAAGDFFVLGNQVNSLFNVLRPPLSVTVAGQR